MPAQAKVHMNPPPTLRNMGNSYLTSNKGKFVSQGALSTRAPLPKQMKTLRVQQRRPRRNAVDCRQHQLEGMHLTSAAQPEGTWLRAAHTYARRRRWTTHTWATWRWLSCGRCWASSARRRSAAPPAARPRPSPRWSPSASRAACRSSWMWAWTHWRRRRPGHAAACCARRCLLARTLTAAARCRTFPLSPLRPQSFGRTLQEALDSQQKIQHASPMAPEAIRGHRQQDVRVRCYGCAGAASDRGQVQGQGVHGSAGAWRADIQHRVGAGAAVPGTLRRPPPLLLHQRPPAHQGARPPEALRQSRRSSHSDVLLHGWQASRSLFSCPCRRYSADGALGSWGICNIHPYNTYLHSIRTLNVEVSVGRQQQHLKICVNNVPVFEAKMSSATELCCAGGGRRRRRR